MPNGDSRQARMNEPLTNLLHKSQKRFGELLRQVCEISGLSQGKLSREAKEELQRLIVKGDIRSEDPVGSLEQPTISKVMAGTQGPTYYQVYIWLSVIRNHYESARFAEICKELGIDPVPEFQAELEKMLWLLSSFTPPEEVFSTYEQTNDLKLVEYTMIEHKEERFGPINKKWDKKSEKTKHVRRTDNKFTENYSYP